MAHCESQLVYKSKRNTTTKRYMTLLPLLVLISTTLLLLYHQQLGQAMWWTPVSRTVTITNQENSTSTNDFSSSGMNIGLDTSVKSLCSSNKEKITASSDTTTRVINWLCSNLGYNGRETLKLNASSCQKVITYKPFGRLGNMMTLYALMIGLSKMYNVHAYVDESMWKSLHNIFSRISLQKISPFKAADCKKVKYQDIHENLLCKEETRLENAKKDCLMIDNYPDRNGIDVFHPYYNDLKKEFEFSDTLKLLSDQFLINAKGNRTSATFIGFHIRRTDYKDYIQKNYHMRVPGETYYSKCLDYYRRRFKDALFIVCSDEMEYVRSVFKSSQSHPDVVLAGNGVIDSPARDMALLAACNHSIVTVGTYGFWGAYLAGGTVLTPEKQTHQSRGDRQTPLLEIQLAGADNWIAIS